MVCSQFDRGEPSEEAEVHREDFSAAQPRVAAENEHAGPGERRIAEREPGDIRRHRVAFPDDLDPGEGEEERCRRPYADCRRKLENPFRVKHLPRIEQRPEIAEKRAEIGEPDPPRDPDERGREIAEGILGAEKSGRDDKDKNKHRYGTQRSDNRWRYP